MINTSNEYKAMIRRNRVFIPKATIILADATSLQIPPKDIMSGGLKIEDSVGEKVSLGTAVINKCSLTLNNFTGKYDAYDFTGAVIRPYVGLQLSETVESLSKGVFNIDRPTVSGPVVILEALDNMYKFDTVFSEVDVSFPCTASQLLLAICLHCGVNLGSPSFLNSGYIIDKRPDNEAISCREVVSWIAQLAGCYARCNTNGALVLDWYDFEAFESEVNLDGGLFDRSAQYNTGDDVDGGNFTNYNSGDTFDGGSFQNLERMHHLYSFSTEPTIGTDDIYITGIQVTDSSEEPKSVLFGSTGYILPITGNELIQNENQATSIANSVGNKIVGMHFRTLSCSTLSDPSMEAGDVGYVTTRKNNSYPVLFTSLSFTLGNWEPVSCGAETPAQSNFRPTQEMKAIIEARKNIKQQLTSYDLAVQQLTNLMTNSFGVYKSEEKLEDGSVIYYMHNKPTVAESSTIWKMTADAFAVSTDGGKTWRAGFDSNGNAVVNVLNAIGINADWINVGTIKGIRVEMQDGTIGKFKITDDGLENDTFKLYDADGAPWMWMYDLDEKESTTMQTVGFAKLREYDTYRTQTTLKEELIMEKTDSASNEDLHVVTISKNGINSYTENINEDGYFTILTDYGTLSFYENYAVFQSYSGASFNIDNGNVSIQSLNCSILLNDNDVFINSNRSNGGVVYVDGFDVAGSFRNIESDIYAIKQRIGLT